MNPDGNPNQVPGNSDAIPGSSSLGNNYPWNVVNPNAQANRCLNDVLAFALTELNVPANNGQQDNGILQNPAILPILSDNRSKFKNYMEVVIWVNGGNNPGIPIPKASGDFPAESSVGLNYLDIGQTQPGSSTLSTTSTQTESFDHFNPLLPVVPASANPHDCGEVYVKHPDDGRATTFVDVDGLPEEESRTLSHYESSRIASDEPHDDTVNGAQFVKELPLSNEEESVGFGGVRLNSLIVESVQSIAQEQLPSGENSGFVDTTGRTVPLQDNDLNNNATTVPYVVSLDEKAVPQTDILPEVAVPEIGDKGSDISSQVPTTAFESEAVGSSEATTLFCGLEGVSSIVFNVYPRCIVFAMLHRFGTTVQTLENGPQSSYICSDNRSYDKDGVLGAFLGKLGFHNEYLSNEFFHKIDVDGNYTVYTCQRLLPGGKTTALRLVEATRGEVSSLYDQDYKGPIELQPRRGPFVRQGGFCPAFVMVKRDGERYNVKICDWHLHGSVIPTRALEMIGTMLLLKNLSPPLVRVIIQGQTTEFCTPMSSLDLYIRRLDLKQFECLCEFVRKRYADHIDVLRRKMGTIVQCDSMTVCTD
ncbi:unnamed protein product [Angiostrongylus costaricensis]|uniref:ULP_PROTEASE domain-containing protein n=1 Tax=Angiostrongylus costaricensis TaxID=334426 RepID=A0A158PKN2_ANGCS|nr:unnamed protein product [Angiostrongylus costaricensis]